MKNGRFSIETHGICLALHPQIRQVTSQFIVHVTDAQAQRGTTATHIHFISCIIIAQIAIGDKRPHSEHIPLTSKIVECLLKSVTITAGIFAAIIFCVKQGLVLLIIPYRYGKITGSLSAPRRENSRCFHSRQVVQIIKRSFHRTGSDNIGTQAFGEALYYLAIKFGLIVDVYLVNTSRQDCHFQG